MEGIDVSRLSVAECLALAEQQENDGEKGKASDPVEDFLGRIAEDAAELTQILGEAATADSSLFFDPFLQMRRPAPCNCLTSRQHQLLRQCMCGDQSRS